MARLTLTLDNSNSDASLIKEIAGQIKNGGIAVIPTDTIYGIVGSAKIQETIEKIYKLRKRAKDKPMIILISKISQISDLGIKITKKQKEIFKKLWPNKISIIIDVLNENLHYLHRGKNSLGFRLPDNEFLIKVLEISGPIVAPSANFEGEKSSKNIEDAKKYFKDSIPLYIDSGTLKSEPSTIVQLKNSELKILREGPVKIPKELL